MNILILLMSCNKDIYEKEEQACRDTFLKDAHDLGVSYYFYKGTNDENPEHFVDDKNHVMYLPVNDGLSGTAMKTVLAFSEALKMEGWDYVLKTNVSTWLDLPKIVKAVDKWEGRDDRNIYGARFIVNEASRKVPFARGHFTILSRSLVDGIVKIAPSLLSAEKFPKTDDTLICLSTLYYIQKALGDNYMSRLMEVPSVISWTESIQESQEWTDALSIRCKDEAAPENTPDNMRKAHKLKRAKNQGRTYRRPMNLIETKYGLQRYGLYEQLATLIERVKQQNEAMNKQPDRDNKLVKIREKLDGILKYDGGGAK